MSCIKLGAIGGRSCDCAQDDEYIFVRDGEYTLQDGELTLIAHCAVQCGKSVFAHDEIPHLNKSPVMLRAVAAPPQQELSL